MWSHTAIADGAVGVTEQYGRGHQLKSRECITEAVQCYTPVMPTTRPRHFVTETDELAEALDANASRWPGLSRAQLLVRLALEGHHAAQHAVDEQRERRLAALRRHSGMLAGAYPPDHLEQLREEWPT